MGGSCVSPPPEKRNKQSHRLWQTAGKQNASEPNDQAVAGDIPRRDPSPQTEHKHFPAVAPSPDVLGRRPLGTPRHTDSRHSPER